MWKFKIGSCHISKKKLSKYETFTKFYTNTPSKWLIQINLLINPGLRFFLNIAQYSNDAPYCLLPSCKKSEISHD